MDGIAGLAGWQWLFLVEGLPVVFVGLSLLWLLADRPEDTAGCRTKERRIVRERLEASAGPRKCGGFGSRSATRAC